MRGISIVVLIAVLAAGCSSTSAATTTTLPLPTTSPTTAPTVPVTTVPPSSTTLAAEDFPAAALFLAAVDDALASTSYAGAAFDDPEGFLATGVVFCDLLDEGLTLEETVDAYAAALVEAAPEEGVEAEDLLLGGVVLGAAIRLICPQHNALLDAEGP
jgi:Protein of unknown function (DUF732)